ncbi:MAG: hypothetical protein HIU89_18310 [Proteobacteria bacterium]|nr:hypothetical protein [Pseudomonadota bacterium]
MNIRPIDRYILAQLEADRAAQIDAQLQVDAPLCRLASEDYPQAKPDPVGEWLLVPVMAVIALVGGLLMGLRL